jgi:hypothetical protein
MGIKIIQFMNQNPVFKGSGLIILGMAALLFAMYMKKRWKEPRSIGFYIFIALAVFILLYGLLILILRPQWWLPPHF